MKSYQRSLLLLATAACASLPGFPALAHHSLTTDFDVGTELELRGRLTNIEWYNPHIWLYFDVVNEHGVVQKWQCEMGSPTQLSRAGWKSENFPAGIIIRVRANRARDGSNTCSTRNIMLDDGTPVFSRRL